MNELVLTGLDGSNPLAFFAALGVLEALDGWARRTGSSRPRLRWSPESFRPSISLEGEHDIFVVLESEISSPEIEQVIAFRHLKIEKNGPKVTGSLAMQRAVLRRWLEVAIEQGAWPSVRVMAGLVCEAVVGTDKDAPDADALTRAGVAFSSDVALTDIVQQTPFDFTSRNTQFLDQIRIIRGQIAPTMIQAALMGGVLTERDKRTMNWDPLFEMPYALFNGRGPTTSSVFEWFMFRSLRFFPVMPTRTGDALVAGMRGRRKAGTIRWPLWSGWLGIDLITSALGLDLYGDESQLAGRGVFARFESRLMKTADGYDGAISPSTPV